MKITDKVVQAACYQYDMTVIGDEASLVAMRAALEAVAPMMVPDGWKLVPVVPTHQMLDVGSIATSTINYWSAPSKVARAWGEMLAAAPTPPNTTCPND